MQILSIKELEKEIIEDYRYREDNDFREFLDENSPYYNANVKGMKTGTMASSYNIVVLYEKDGKAYLITCLAAHSNEGRYKAVQSAINTIIE